VDAAALRCLYGYLPATLSLMAAAARRIISSNIGTDGQQRA